MKEKKPRLIFHTIFTYVFLPLAIVFGILYGIGNFENIYRIPGVEKPFSLIGESMTSSTPILLLILLFPILLTIMLVISFPGLIKRKPFGRGWIVTTEIFTFIYSLYLGTPFLLKHLNIELTLLGAENSSLEYGITCLSIAAFSLFVFIYYLSKSKYFKKEKNIKNDDTSTVTNNEEVDGSVTGGENSLKEEQKEITEEEKQEALFSFGEDDLTTQLYEEEKKEEVKEENVEMMSEEAKEKDLKKILRIIPATFNPNSPLIIKDIILKILPGKTLLSFTVLNRSERDYIEAGWLINGKYHLITPLSFLSISENVLSTMINEELEQANIKIESIKDDNSFLETFDTSLNNGIPFADKSELKRLSSDDRFKDFLSKYISMYKVDAKYVYKRNINGSALTCPVCGEMVLKDENECKICKTTKVLREAFTKESVLSAFEEYLKTIS